jgi:SEC-C motif-containing protein
MAGTVVFEVRHREGVLRETSFFQRRGGRTDGDWQYIKALAPLSQGHDIV